MHSMSEEIVSGHVQALPGPLVLQLTPPEDGSQSSLPRLELKHRSDHEPDSVCFLSEGGRQRKEDISGYGLLSEGLIYRDVSMPGPLEEMDRRQAGVEEPQVAKEAILVDSQRPLESAKTPDMSLISPSHHPPQLERVNVEEHEAGERLFRAEDDSLLQLPVLQREHVSVLGEAEDDEQCVPSVTSTQAENEHTNALQAASDLSCPPNAVKNMEERNGAIRPTKRGFGVNDIRRKKPVVILKRLTKDILDSYKQSVQAPGKNSGNSQYRQLTVRVDQGSQDQSHPESGNDDQSKKTKNFKNRSKFLHERLSPLNQMLEESGVWNKFPLPSTASRDSFSADVVQLDEISSSDAERKNHSSNSSVTVKFKENTASTLSRSLYSGGKSAGVVDKRQTADQDPPLLQPCLQTSDSNHSDRQSSTNSLGHICKSLKQSDRLSNDSGSVPISYTAFSPGALKMTFISRNKSSANSRSLNENNGLEIGSGKSSPKEPSVDGWENCPDVIFDCGSQGRSVLLKAASDVSENPDWTEHTEEHDRENVCSQNSSADLGLGNDPFWHIADNQPSQSCSGEDQTGTGAFRREMCSVRAEGRDSVSLSQSDNTAVRTHAAHGNTAESTSSFVPSTSRNNPSQSAKQASSSSKDDNREKHTATSALEFDQAREIGGSEIVNRTLDDHSVDLAPSHSQRHKNALYRWPVQAKPAAARLKLTRNGLQSNVQGKRLQISALPSKISPTSTGAVPQRVHQSTRPCDSSCDNSKVQSSSSRQQPHSVGVGKGTGKEPRADLGPLSPVSSLSAVTVLINGEHPTHSSGQECAITCIEKTSPAFIIPHQEQKMVESDMIVMQNYYYSTLPSAFTASKTGVGCCQKAGDDGAADHESATVCNADSSRSLATSKSHSHLVPTLTQDGDSCELAETKQCFSNQSHLENTGILMVNTNATKTHSVQVAPGRQRGNFRSLSEDSDKNGNAAYKDIVLSSVTVDDKSFYTSVDALDLVPHADDQTQSVSAQIVPADNPAGQEQCLCESLGAEGESAPEQKPEDVTISLQSEASSVGEEILMALEEEENLLQNFEGEIMGQVQIRQDNADFDEVFDIVNERDVPIPHEAFLHSLSLLRNTGKTASACEPPQPQKRTSLDSFCFGFFHDVMEHNKEKLEDDSDATLPYPRDEKRERAKPQSKPRKPRRSRKRKRKTAKPKKTAVSAAAVPDTSSKIKPVPAKLRGKPAPQTKLIEIPDPVKGTRRGEKTPLRKKSATRHPLFKQRHQAASRRPKDKPQTAVSKPAAQFSPPKTPSTVAKTTSPSVLLKHSMSTTVSPSRSSESDSGSFFHAGSLPKDCKSPNTPVRTTCASATASVPKSKASRAVSSRATIAINTVPARSPAKAAQPVSGPQKAEGRGKRRRKLDKEPETSAREEKTDRIFEGTRLTDESDSDELPTIVPPKRRRQQTSQRGRKAAALGSAEKAASAAAAVEVKRAMQDSWVDAQGTERIMREFPRHNWLEHKILQKNTYTPPAAGLSSPVTAVDSTDPRGVSSPRGVGSPKAAKRSESCDAAVLDRTHAAEPHGVCAARSLSSSTSMASYEASPVMDKVQDQNVMFSSPSSDEGAHCRTAISVPATLASRGGMGGTVHTCPAVGDQLPLVTTVSLHSASPTTSVYTATAKSSAKGVCPPNFLNVDEATHNSLLSATAGDRLPASGKRPEGARAAGQDRRASREPPEDGSHTAAAGRQVPMVCAPRLVSRPCTQTVAAPVLAAQSSGSSMMRPILVPVSFPVQPARIPVIPLMTRIPSVPVVPQLNTVVTTVPYFPTAARQVMPIQPHIAPKPSLILPAASALSSSAGAQSGVPPSQVLRCETNAAPSSDMNPYEENVSSPPDLSPGRLHIDIGDVSPSREERVTPTSVSATHEDSDRHEAMRETSPAVPQSNPDKAPPTALPLTDPHRTPTQDVPQLPPLSAESPNIHNTADSGTNPSTVRRTPAQTTPTPLLRSRSSSALPVGGWREKNGSGEGGKGKVDAGTCGGRRKSWEQTHRDQCEEEEVEVTLVELTTRSTARAAAAVSGSLPISVSTGAISTVAAVSAVATASPSTPACDMPVPPLEPTPQPLPQLVPPAPQPETTPAEASSLPPPPSLIPTSSSHDWERGVGVVAEAGRGKEEVMLSPGSSEAGVPLDLCTQKSEVLGGSRVRTNPPVQLVLPQVQPKPDVTATTTTTSTATTTTTTSCTPPSAPSLHMVSPNDIIASTKLVLKVISENLASVGSQRLPVDATGLEEGAEREDKGREVAGGHWTEIPTGKASASPEPSLFHLPQGGEKGTACSVHTARHDRDRKVNEEQPKIEPPLGVGSEAAEIRSQDVSSQHSESSAAAQDSVALGSQPPRDPELSPQSSELAEEERLRSQLRELEQMAARKKQEREQLLMLHKRKAEMLTEIESKRRRTTASATCSSTAAEPMDTSSSTDTPEAPDSKATPAGAPGSQDRPHPDRALTEQLEALRRVLIAAITSLPPAVKEDSASPRPQQQASAAPVSEETGAGPSSGVLDLSSSGRKEKSPSAEERRPLVQMINQALQLMNPKHEHKPEGGTVPSGDRTGEEEGSARPAHQTPKGVSGPSSDPSQSPSPMVLNSPYTRRQTPLNEPPVPGSKQSQVEAPKFAHSQPPFQPAGSLIVPALSAGEAANNAVAGPSGQSQEQSVAGPKRQEEKGKDHGPNVVESKSTPQQRNVIDLTRDNEDSARLPDPRSAWRDKYGAKGSGEGEKLVPASIAASLMRTSRCGDIATSSLKGAPPVPVAMSDCHAGAVPAGDFAPSEVIGPRFPCPEETVPRGGHFPPSSPRISPKGPPFPPRLQQPGGSLGNKHNVLVDKGGSMMPARPSTDSGLARFPPHREQQPGQQDHRRGFHGSSENSLTPLGVPRLPGSAVGPAEARSLDVHPPYPAGYPGGVRFTSPVLPAQDQSLVLRNPMDDAHVPRQPPRMAAGVPTPSEYLNKTLPQPPPQKRHPGQAAVSHAFQQQQEAVALQMQQQHSPYLPSRQQQHLQLQQQQQQQQQQQRAQQQPRHQPMPVGQRVSHSGHPAPTSHALAPQPNLSPTRPAGFTHMPRVPYSAGHPPTMPLPHLGEPCSGVPHSGIPHSRVNHPEALPSKVPHSRSAHLSHFGLGGSVPAGVPGTHVSSYYNPGMGVRGGELPSSAPPGLPSPGQHLRPHNVDHIVRSSLQTQTAGGVRPPYFSGPRPSSQPLESPKRIRVGGGGAPFPSASQPYPLPPPQSMPHATSHPSMLQSPKQRAEVDVVAPPSGHPGSRPSGQPPGGQALPSPPGGGRRRKGMCELCGSSAMYLCSLCRAVWYCSQQCQSAHWRTHSTVCKQPNS